MTQRPHETSAIVWRKGAVASFDNTLNFSRCFTTCRLKIPVRDDEVEFAPLEHLDALKSITCRKISSKPNAFSMLCNVDICSSLSSRRKSTLARSALERLKSERIDAFGYYTA